MGRVRMGSSVNPLLASSLPFLLLLLVRNASCAEAGLYLAINPLAFTNGGTADGEVVKRRLEVNWFGEQPLADDYIQLTAPDIAGVSGPFNQTVKIADLTDRS